MNDSNVSKTKYLTKIFDTLFKNAGSENQNKYVYNITFVTSSKDYIELLLVYVMYLNSKEYDKSVCRLPLTEM